MWFWVFMLVMVLLVPLVMIYFGRRFEENAPKNINPVYGYRTSMSMKNKETWEFAHKYIGKLWKVCGWILLLASVIAMLPAIGKDINTVSIISLVIMGIQVIVMVGTIFPTEIALKRTFDKNGNRMPC